MNTETICCKYLKIFRKNINLFVRCQLIMIKRFKLFQLLVICIRAGSLVVGWTNCGNVFLQSIDFVCVSQSSIHAEGACAWIWKFAVSLDQLIS